MEAVLKEHELRAVLDTMLSAVRLLTEQAMDTALANKALIALLEKEKPGLGYDQERLFAELRKLSLAGKSHEPLREMLAILDQLRTKITGPPM